MVFEVPHDAVYITDIRGRVTFTNAAFERLTGYTGDEVFGQFATLFFPSEGPPSGGGKAAARR